MAIALAGGLQGDLDNAAADGLDLIWVVCIHWRFGVGDRYYSTRGEHAFINGGNKLVDIPTIPKRMEISATQFNALNDECTVRLLNTPELPDGTPDPERLQDLMTITQVGGTIVDVGIMPADATSLNDITWQGVYKIDRVDRTAEYVSFYCLDLMLHKGEEAVGYVINQNDFPAAPTSSYSVVRGPVFGKVDTLPLVPVDIGLEATLATDIDEQEGIVDLMAGDMSLWPSQGYVMIGDEILFYPTINKSLKRLGASGSLVRRGQGFPNTIAAIHTVGKVVREFYTGRESILAGTITASQTSIPVSDITVFPASGIVLIDNEAIRYSGKSGINLIGLTRGFAMPTMAAVHQSGSMVRTIPLGFDGKPRFRYLVAELDVDAISNLRVIGADGNEYNYNGTAAISQMTTASGRQVTVADISEIPRVDTYQGETAIDPEWITANDGRVDGEGIALPDAMIRWKKYVNNSGASPFPFHTTILDPRGNGKFVELDKTAQPVIAATFNAKWDTGLNNPRRIFGQLKDARIRFKYQYNKAMGNYRGVTVIASRRTTWTSTLTRSAICRPSGAIGEIQPMSIAGSQDLPKSRWGTESRVQPVQLSVDVPRGSLGPYASTDIGEWINPFNSRPYASALRASEQTDVVVDGNPKTFISGMWNFLGAGFGPRSQSSGTPLNNTDLTIRSQSLLQRNNLKDKVKSIIVTIMNPHGWNGVVYGDKGKIEGAWGGDSTNWSVNGVGGICTGWQGTLYVYSGENLTGSMQSFAVSIGGSDTIKRMVINLPDNKSTFDHVGSLKIVIPKFWLTWGTTIGNVAVELEVLPYLEGQELNTTVQGSFFQIVGGQSNMPSAVYDHTVSLGSMIRDYARAMNVDPWDFFSQKSLVGGVDEGLSIFFDMRASGDPLDVKAAISDVVLEIDYAPLVTEFGGQVVADVDGIKRLTFGPSPTVVEDPVEIAKVLLEDDAFYGLTGFLDSASWLSVLAATKGAGVKCARAVVGEVSLRDLFFGLLGENRVLPVLDGKKIYLRYKQATAQPVQAVEVIGAQADPMKELVSSSLPVVSRIEDVYNSIGFYYRRNYVTGDFRAVIEESNQSSINLFGRRRDTPNLEWHQSARGYANGLISQKMIVSNVTKYAIDVASQLWDFVTVEVSAVAGEKLQRYDVVILNNPRSGYHSATGRVVSKQRLTGPVRWQLILQMPQAAGEIYWFSYQGDTIEAQLRLEAGGTRLDFIMDGVFVASLDALGNFRTSFGYTATVDTFDAPMSAGAGAPNNTALFMGAGDYLRLGYVPSGTGWFTGLLRFDLYNEMIFGTGGPDFDVVTNQNFTGSVGAPGIYDNGAGEVDFVLGGRIVARLNDSGFYTRGSFITGVIF